MIVVIDNNIVLDALLEREPFFADATEALSVCASGHSGYLTANSLTDIYYVLSKSMKASAAKQIIRKLMGLFGIISITETDCINALELAMDDFEDALIVACGVKVSAELIVSRDSAFEQSTSPIEVVSPAEFLLLGN